MTVLLESTRLLALLPVQGEGLLLKDKCLYFLLIFTTKISHTSLPVLNRFAPLTLTQTTPFTFSIASLLQ